jgi:hypothetical protein
VGCVSPPTAQRSSAASCSRRSDRAHRSRAAQQARSQCGRSEPRPAPRDARSCRRYCAPAGRLATWQGGRAVVRGRWRRCRGRPRRQLRAQRRSEGVPWRVASRKAAARARARAGSRSCWWTGPVDRWTGTVGPDAGSGLGTGRVQRIRWRGLDDWTVGQTCCTRAPGTWVRRRSAIRTRPSQRRPGCTAGARRRRRGRARPPIPNRNVGEASRVAPDTR